MSSFFDHIFSIYQCGFRKGFSAQHCLLAMLEKWKSSNDKGKAFGALLTDLSKAFNCLSHELLIAKLDAYGFSPSALKLIHSYLSERKQRTKLNASYSSWHDILSGVPQGSILGPLLFNIFLCDLFLMVENTDFASYADDNTPYTTGENINEVISKLEKETSSLFNWFSVNQMKANPDKCHLLLNRDCKQELIIGDISIENSKYEKLLGIEIDSKLNFNMHVVNLCKKASRKMHVLARITPFMSLPKRRMLLNAFFKSQFNYCPLVWMFHSRAINNKINRLHERCLRIIYNDKHSCFHDLLEKDKSVSVHNRNLQVLAIEMFKVSKGSCPSVFSNIFNLRPPINYNLRNNSEFIIPHVNSVYNGTESISVFGPKIWDMVPQSMKEKESVEEFKYAIKSWKPNNCPCRLCKKYIAGVGFI